MRALQRLISVSAGTFSPTVTENGQEKEQQQWFRRCSDLLGTKVWDTHPWWTTATHLG